MRPLHAWHEAIDDQDFSEWRHTEAQVRGFYPCDCPDVLDVNLPAPEPAGRERTHWQITELEGHIGNPGLSSLDYGVRE